MANIYIKITSGLLELDVDYKIDEDATEIVYLGLESHIYWNPFNRLDNRITSEQIRDLMDTVEKSLFDYEFKMRILTKIPIILQNKKRNDLTAVAMDWLSQYHMNPPKNQMRL